MVDIETNELLVITKTDFKKYEVTRYKSINMLDFDEVSKDSGLSKHKVKIIFNNWKYYKEKWDPCNDQFWCRS